MRGVRGGTGSAALPPGRELEGGGSHRTAGKRRRIPAAHGHGSSTAPRGHRGQSRARTVSPHPQEMGALLEELWGWHSAGDMAEQGGVRNAPLCCSRGAGERVQPPPPGAPRTALPHAAACPACSGTRNPWAWCSGGHVPRSPPAPLAAHAPPAGTGPCHVLRPPDTGTERQGLVQSPWEGAAASRAGAGPQVLGGPRQVASGTAGPPGRAGWQCVAMAVTSCAGLLGGLGQAVLGSQGCLGCQSCPAWGPTAAPLLPCTSSSSSSSSQRPRAAAPHHRGLAHRQKTFH